MRIVTSTIPAAGTAASAPVTQHDGHHLAGIQVPATWTAADITFQGSADGSTAPVPLYDKDGVLITVKVAVGRITCLPADLLLGCSSVVIVSTVAQSAAAAVTLVFRQYA